MTKEQIRCESTTWTVPDVDAALVVARARLHAEKAAGMDPIVIDRQTFWIDRLLDIRVRLTREETAA